MTDDDITPIERPPRHIVSLNKLDEYVSKLTARGQQDAVNEALILQQLIASLRANAERDLLMAQMASRFDDLERQFREERALHSVAYQALVSEFHALQRQQDEIRQNLDVVAAVVDVGITKISEVVRKIENLSASVADVTEP